MTIIQATKTKIELLLTVYRRECINGMVDFCLEP